MTFSQLKAAVAEARAKGASSDALRRSLSMGLAFVNFRLPRRKENSLAKYRAAFGRADLCGPNSVQEAAYLADVEAERILPGIGP